MATVRHSERRQAILQAAGKIFLDKGYQGATTLDIASAAGVSKRDLYALFRTKDQILVELISTSVERFSAPVQLSPARSRVEAVATLEAFARGFLAFLLSDEPVGLYRLAIAAAERQPGPGAALLRAGVAGTIDLVDAYIRRAVSAGHLNIARADIRDAVAAFLNTVIGRLQMERLLDPAAPIPTTRIDANVAAALRVLLLFEAAPSSRSTRSP